MAVNYVCITMWRTTYVHLVTKRIDKFRECTNFSNNGRKYSNITHQIGGGMKKKPFKLMVYKQTYVRVSYMKIQSFGYNIIKRPRYFDNPGRKKAVIIPAKMRQMSVDKNAACEHVALCQISASRP